MKYAMAVLAMTAGTGLIMWLAAVTTERGAGAGRAWGYAVSSAAFFIPCPPIHVRFQ